MESTVPGINNLVETSLLIKVKQATHNIPRQLQWRLFVISLIVSDIVMAAAGFRLAYFIRFELNLPFFYLEQITPVTYYERIVLILMPFWLVLFTAFGLYDRKHLLGGAEEYGRVFNATTVGMFALIAAGFLDPDFVIARGWLLLAWFIVFFLTALGRFVLRRVVYFLRPRGYFISQAVIVGANDEGLSLAQQLYSWKTSGLHVLGFVDEKLPPVTRVSDQFCILGTVDDLDSLVSQYDIEEVILASSAISSREKMLEIFKRYGVGTKVNVRLSSGLYEIITTGLSVKEFAYVPLVGVNQVRLTGVDRVLKFLLDYGLTIPGLILISPLLLLIAIAIKLDSPGPVIHRRRVMGVNGQTFDAYKFRTMYVNGDEILEQYPELKAQLNEEHKLKDDPRVTRVGRFLRRTSLDELPQLFNVLKREMSLVGPRMISPAEIEKYDQWNINLLTVQPGITGLWQVSGRSDISYEQRVRLDMHYIRNWSIWLDLQLLLQTIPAVIKRRGAY